MVSSDSSFVLILQRGRRCRCGVVVVPHCAAAPAAAAAACVRRAAGGAWRCSAALAQVVPSCAAGVKVTRCSVSDASESMQSAPLLARKLAFVQLHAPASRFSAIYLSLCWDIFARAVPHQCLELACDQFCALLGPRAASAKINNACDRCCGFIQGAHKQP